MRSWVLAVAVAVALAVWGTWPLAAHLRTHAYDPGGHAGGLAWVIRADVYLTHWILAWGAHALITAPTRLFEANLFHPAPHALALSENMLGAMPVYLPLALGSGDPVFAHQATLLATFVLSFLAALALARDWSGSWAAGVLAGGLFAFSPFRLGHLGALQVEGTYYLPLIPLCARRSVESGRAWPALLGAVLALQALHSYYLGYAAFLATGVLVVTVLVLDPAARRRWPRLVLPVLGALLVVALISLPYLRARGAGVLETPSGDLLARAAASLGGTGATPALVLSVLALPWWRRGLRPGVGGVWLVALALAALVTHLLAVGPEVRIAGRTFAGPWALLAPLVPGLGMLRILVRLNAPATMALAVLAGIGVVGALRAAGGTRPTPWLAPALAVFIAAAAPLTLRGPLPLRAIESGPSVPPVYRWLATAPAGPMLEVPFDELVVLPLKQVSEARRVYLSVYHWQPILGGYSGYIPATYRPVGALARALPDPRAVELLVRTTGLRHVVLHREELSPAQRRRWRERPRALRVVRVVGRDVVLAPRERRPADLEAALLAGGSRGTTVLGTPLAPLDPGDRRGAVRAQEPAPRTVPAARGFAVDVRVTNLSRATWPTLASASPHLVRFAYRWEPANGGATVESSAWDRLPYDLAPGESLVAAVPMTIREPGPGRLLIGLAQDGRWFGGEVASVPLVVEPAPSS